MRHDFSGDFSISDFSCDFSTEEKKSFFRLKSRLSPPRRFLKRKEKKKKNKRKRERERERAVGDVGVARAAELRKFAKTTWETL